MTCQCLIKHVSLCGDDIYCRTCNRPLFPELAPDDVEAEWREPALFLALAVCCLLLAHFLTS